LRAQSYPASRFEIIVVDNGSSDGTAEIACRFGGRVISEPRKGVARARQIGFEAARGEVIASTNADTQVPPRWVARITAHFQGYLAVDGVYDPVHWREWGVRLVTADMVTEFIHNATSSLSQFE